MPPVEVATGDQLGARRPGPAGDRPAYAGWAIGQPSGGQRHHLVRPVRPQPGPALGIDLVAHPGPPVQPVLGAAVVTRLDLAGPVDAGQPVQLLGHAPLLQPSLRGKVDVLEVAAAAQAGTGDRAAAARPGPGSAPGSRPRRPARTGRGCRR